MPDVPESNLLLVIMLLLASMSVAGLVVVTQRWHWTITSDSLRGIQKVHRDPIPRIGGVGIYLSLWLAVFYLNENRHGLLEMITIAALPAFLAGLAEDITKRIGISARLLATMTSGVLAWWLTGNALWRLDLPVADSILSYTPFAVVFTAFAVAGVANSINLIDGFNGLASGTVMICLAGLAGLAATQGDWEMFRIAIIVCVVTLGFFLLNFPFGRLFLGDGGAYLIGFLLAWIGVMISVRHPDTISPAAVLLICSYPVLETVFSIFRRSRRGKAIDRPDRMHLHSLVYRRLVPKIIKKFCNRPQGALCNAATSPFMWAFCAVPVLAGVLLRDNTLACWVAIGMMAIAYDTIYRRLSQFRWVVLGITLSSRRNRKSKA